MCGAVVARFRSYVSWACVQIRELCPFIDPATPSPQPPPPRFEERGSEGRERGAPTRGVRNLEVLSSFAQTTTHKNHYRRTPSTKTTRTAPDAPNPIPIHKHKHPKQDTASNSITRTWREGRTLLTQFSYSPYFTSKRGESTPTLLMRPISCSWFMVWVGVDDANRRACPCGDDRT